MFAVGVLICLIVVLACPEMGVFAGLLDASMFDVLITVLGVQLLLYSDQLKAGLHLSGQAIARGYRRLRQPRG